MPATVDTFRRYANACWIETGTWQGAGIDAALSAGFTDVRSVELSPELHDAAATRFRGRAEVKLWCGPSVERLAEMLADVAGPATFWLDAHYSGGGTARGSEVCPLLQEIAAIGEHGVKTHTLLIDDIRLFDGEFGVSLAAVMQAIARIHPGYVFSLEQSAVAELGFDILVARVPSACALPP